MVDTRYCTAGRNAQGDWYLACKDSRTASTQVLEQLGYDQSMSTPNDTPYHQAARHIRDNGGLFWRTNTKGEYSTIVGIPNTSK